MGDLQTGLAGLSENTGSVAHEIWTFSRHGVSTARPDYRYEYASGAIASRWDACLRRDTVAVAVLSRDLIPDVSTALEALLAEIRLASSAVILVPYKTPPAAGTRPDGRVTSFLCDVETFRTIADRHRGEPTDTLCFRLLHGLLNRTLDLNRIVVRQVPAPARRAPSPSSGSSPRPVRAGLVMAHRGSPLHLAAALASIQSAEGGDRVAVRVGLDEEDLTPYRDLRRQARGVTFFQVSPAPAGLFVIRQRLIESTPEDLFFLQDSDDMSCSDRFAAQIGELHHTGCDLLGCHELRVDELNETVEAFRLPLDVQEALHAGYSHSLLNGTVVGSRKAVLAAGGYSTDQRLANDTQFTLRAYFSLRMLNIDGFYYIRRRHGAALTVAPETGFGTPLREHLASVWARDFDAVRTGALALSASTLRRMDTEVDYAITEWAESVVRAKGA